MKEFQSAIGQLDASAAGDLLDGGTIEVLGESFSSEEIQVLRQAKPGSSVVSDRYISIELDCELTPALIEEGYAREIVNRVQQARKEQGLQVSDRILLQLRGDTGLLAAAQNHRDYVSGEVLAVELNATANNVVANDEASWVSVSIDDKALELQFWKSDAAAD